MSIDIRNYDSRNEFILDLKLWHHNKDLEQNEFVRLKPVSLNYSKELKDLKNNLEQVKKTWNDQSIATIRKHVTESGNEQSLQIIKNQENDKIKAGIELNKAMYHVNSVDKDSIWYKIAENYPLKSPMVRLHVQFPSDVTMWHTDIFAPYHNLLPISANLSPDEIGKDVKIRRILIALDDWDWGQCFMFGSDIWYKWKAGEAIFWNYGVPHCSANMGFTPRISMSITGILNSNIENFYE